MSTNRDWMWHRKDDNSYLVDKFVEGVKDFLKFAYEHPDCVTSDNKIRCPCSDCRNRYFFIEKDVHYHLVKNGFTRGYDLWHAHGEPLKKVSHSIDSESVQNEDGSSYKTMVMEGIDQCFDWTSINNDQPPNLDAQKFFDLLKDADEPLCDGCKNHTKLSVVTQLLNLKSEFNMPEACYDRLVSIIKGMLPETENLPPNLYKTKKQLANLGLGYVKIDACVNHCILYYEEYKDHKECPVCFHPRFKPRKPRVRKEVPFSVLRYLPLIPRLKRLYASSYTSKQMTWHAKNNCENGKMAHPSHGEAWNHFDRTYPSFASDSRNVHLRLCTDGFSPFGHQSTPYSCWPVIITVYNLPPWMCMQKPFMFLNMVIPGPKSPGKNIDVFLRPLVDELKILWTTSVETYDLCSKQNFLMKAALLWTISDFPVYGMLSGWSTHGRLACPYCMEHTKSFLLQYGRKPSWFDCHRQFLPCDHPFRRQAYNFRKGKMEKDYPPLRLRGEQICERVNRLPHVTFGKPPSSIQPIDGFGRTHNWVKKSIFWELPYWKTNLIRHNLDVMHIEKNVFDNVFNTIMDVKDKTKDNAKARKDLEQHCSRPELNLIGDANGKFFKPKAAYTLSKLQMKEMCNWAKSLKLPDGYSTNISRCVNEHEHKFSGMKSHDCHIFMQRLLPAAFRDLLPKSIWEVLTELSNYFRDICATVLRVEYMQQIESNIIEIICKLERIFPLAFFDSMENFPIHLAYEAKVGGPVQYRWMYPFERFLYHLKKKVGNRAHVEASIVEAYIIEEVTTFCSSYFEPQVKSLLNRIPRNDDGGAIDSSCRLSIFTHPGRALGSRFTTRYLKDDKLKAAHRYILMNCDKIIPFVRKFNEEKKQQIPGMTERELQILCDQQFPQWLLSHIKEISCGVDDDIKKLAHGPNRRVSCYKEFFVNGFKFETVEHGRYKATSNYGVCVLGSTIDEYEVDYYGVLEEVIGLEFYGLRDEIVLFKCHWYATSDKGVKVHKLGLVEINHKSKLNTNDPFILASQAQQVYYTVSPSTKRERNNWMIVCKVKARAKFDIPLLQEQEESVPPNAESAFQEEHIPVPHPIIIDMDIDEVNIVIDEEDELDSEEIEELQHARSERVILDGEELEEELEDFELDEETESETNHDSDDSVNEMETDD